MKKTLYPYFAFLLLISMGACSKSSGGDSPEREPNVAKEITDEELQNFYIVEEYTPKPEYVATTGTKPYLLATYIKRNLSSGIFSTHHKAGDIPEDIVETILSYDSETGITTLKTYFGDYALTRDNNKQIIVTKSNHYTRPDWWLSKIFTSSYIQLVKTSNDKFYDIVYKAVSGRGYYRFSLNKWRYKQDAVPNSNELTWSYSQLTNTIWYGNDGGAAAYYNLFLILPKGNGWKGQSKDKDLLIVNTIDLYEVKAVGDIGIYTINN